MALWSASLLSITMYVKYDYLEFRMAAVRNESQLLPLGKFSSVLAL